jgi:hypothetical protein
MAANPTICLRGDRGHTGTTVLSQSTEKKPAESRYSLRQPVVRSPPIFFDGPAEFADSAHRMCEFTPADLMDLNFSTERAQGHFLSPWSKGVGPFTQKNHDDLFVRISAVRKSLLLVFRKNR